MAAAFRFLSLPLLLTFSGKFVILDFYHSNTLDPFILRELWRRHRRRRRRRRLRRRRRRRRRECKKNVIVIMC